MNTFNVRVEAGDRDRPAGLVDVPLELHGPEMMPVAVRVLQDGTIIPSQYQHVRTEGGAKILFIADALKAGETAEFQVQLIDAGDSGPEETIKGGVRLSDSGEAIDFTVDGEPFTSYFYHTDRVRPHFHPLRAAASLVVTRSWPMEEGPKGEDHDHPHHKGLWVAHGDVNGVDNWSEEKNHGWQKHRTFDTLQSGPVRGYMDAHYHWTEPGGAPVLSEARHAAVHVLPDGTRILDLEVHFTAEHGPVTFGDTKEGGICAVRVATSMTGTRGGKIESATGGVGEAQCWGKQADWCDYSGDVDGQRVGIAILDHPDSFRHPTYWHVRDYGLMTANPFGVAAFTGDAAQNGSHTLPAGESLLFRYRVVVHRGDASQADIAGHYANWTDPHRVVIENL